MDDCFIHYLIVTACVKDPSLKTSLMSFIETIKSKYSGQFGGEIEFDDIDEDEFIGGQSNENGKDSPEKQKLPKPPKPSGQSKNEVSLEQLRQNIVKKCKGQIILRTFTEILELSDP